MGAANAKCSFTFYDDIEVHKCENKKMKSSVYYKYQSGLTTDLHVVNEAEKYRKKIIRYSSDCTCSGDIVQLEIYEQMAITNRYIPHERYEYKIKHVVDTGYGFVYWLHSITCGMRGNDNELDLFINGLVPGTLFYDGEFIRRIAAEIQQKLDFKKQIIKSEPKFLEALERFIEYAQKMKKNSVVTNVISSK